jgi:hypothetical protein
MLIVKCSVKNFDHGSVSQLGCIHLSLAAHPTSTLGETSSALQVSLKGSVVRVLLVR